MSEMRLESSSPVNNRKAAEYTGKQMSDYRYLLIELTLKLNFCLILMLTLFLSR